MKDGPGPDRTLTECAVDQLVAMIEREGLKTGSKLPTVEALCTDLGVSRTVVREAVARLTAAGRLTSRRGSGIFVATTAPGVSLGAPQNLSEILDMLELRLAVEVESARLAAGRMTSDGLIALDGAMRTFERTVSQWEFAADADLAFHAAVAQASGNAQFVRFLDGIAATAIPRRSLAAQFPDDVARAAYLERLAAEHVAIHEGIVNRDPEAAARAMRTHLEGSRRRYWRWSSDAETAGNPA